MKTKDQTKVVVDSVLARNDRQEASSTVPQSVVENTILIGRVLDIHPVDRLAYSYDKDAFMKVCQGTNLNPNDAETLKQIIDLNSGYISAALLRANLPYGYAFCSRLSDELVSEEQAAPAPKGRVLYLLPDDKRAGWLKGAVNQDTITAS